MTETAAREHIAALAKATDSVLADLHDELRVTRGRIARKALANLDALNETQARIEARIETLEAVHDTFGWSRFITVVGGHIHSGTECKGGTIRYNTMLGWLPELSGETEADAVAAHGPLLCTHCFPSAPVEWTTGAAPQVDPTKCDNKIPVRGSGTNRYAACGECGSAWVALTPSGLLRKHKRPTE